MPTVRLDVSLPPGGWTADVTRDRPDATVRVLAALAGGDVDVGLATVATDAPGSVLETVRAHPTVPDLAVVSHDDREMTLQFETDRWPIIGPARQARLPVVLPVTVRAGTATVEARGTSDRVSAFTALLERADCTFEVVQVSGRSGPGDDLSPRQRELVETAIAHGYYAVPRSCTLTELADEEGIAKSTCSEVLHRAEAAIVEAYMDRSCASDQAGTRAVSATRE